MFVRFVNYSWIHQDNNFDSKFFERLRRTQRVKYISHVFTTKYLKLSIDVVLHM